MVPTIQLLGPVAVTGPAGELNEVGRPRQRAVLSALALSAGRPVSRPALIRAVWGELPPASALGNLQTYVSGLRKLVGKNLLRADESGYRLALDPDNVDALVLLRLVEEAHARRASPQCCLEILERAGDLWRGEPLGGVDGPFAHAERVRLRELWLSARELRAEMLLAVGRPAEAVVECAGFAAEHPLRERLFHLLARGLAECGRVSDALAELAGIRDRLKTELDVEPGRELTDLYQSILDGDTHVEHDDPPPAQLPHRVRGFAGREFELARLTSSTTPWLSISGMAGAGKTALAVEVAHRMASRFPDGQLYVNLRGFDLHERPTSIADALEYLLRSLGLSPDEVPDRLAERIERYRDTLRGKRMLVLLDNAATEVQIRPLLPIDGSSLAIVTSRNRLGDDPLVLSALDERAAVELLADVAGFTLDERTRPKIARVAQLCGHLPLALRIAAARLSVESDGGQRYAAALADERGRLDALATDDDDESTAVRAAFNQSYARLPSAAARLFALLGLHPGPEFDERALAALAGGPPEVAALVEQNLVDVVGPRRYRVHDLVRVFAADRAGGLEPEVSSAAVSRVLAWYTHSVHAADTALVPKRSLRQELGELPDGCVPVTFADYAEAHAWCARERANLLGAVRLAHEHGRHGVASSLLDGCTYYLNAERHWADWVAMSQLALASARIDGDAFAISAALGRLAQAHYSRGEHVAAHARFAELATAIEEGGLDRRLLRFPYTGLGSTCRALGDLPSAARYFERVLELLDGADPFYEAWSLAGLGELYQELGRLDEAVETYERSVALGESWGEPHGLATSLLGLARMCEVVGRYERAAEAFRRAASLASDIGNRHLEEDAARGAAKVYDVLGASDEARTWSHRAEELLSA